MGGEESAFRMENLGPEARSRKLDPGQGMALAQALQLAERLAARAGHAGAKTPPGGPDAGRDSLRSFLLPFAAFGLDAAQMLGLLEKVPAGWPLDHREMYYDFRLERWQRHIEPPSVAEILDEYADNAPTPEEGLAYLRAQWSAFLKRRGAAS
jgi:hypothetical protein